MMLATGKKLHDVDIGTCADPKILLKSGSCSPDSQTVTGAYTFNTNLNKKPLILTKTVLANDGDVNGNDWSTIMDSFVSKTALVAAETFTKKKTFQQASFEVDPSIQVEFSSDVFGLTPENEPTRYFDMSFPSGDNEDIEDSVPLQKTPNMPDLSAGITKIADNSLLLEEQFSHLKPIYTTLDRNQVSKSISLFTEFTEEEFVSLPFHLATLFGDITTNRVGVLFHRMTALEGDIQLVGVPETETDPNIGAVIPLGYMARDTNGIHEAFGQVLPLKVGITRYYAVLLKELNGLNSIRIYLYTSLGSPDLALQGVKEEDGNWLRADDYNFDHITALGSSNEACFVGCGEVSKVVCLKGEAGRLVIDGAQTKTLDNSPTCFHSSSISVTDGNTYMATASHQSRNTGTINIYDVTNPTDITEFQVINCHMCSHLALDHYMNQKGVDHVFIVILSYTRHFVSIGELEEGKFVSLVNIEVTKPSDAIFFNHDGYLYLSVTAGSDQETEIKRFMYRGYMAFTEMEELNVKLMGIKSHNIISHPLLDAPLVSSTGNADCYF